MMLPLKKFLILVAAICYHHISNAQNLTLQKAIAIAQSNSIESKVAANNLQIGKWDYKNFNTQFLPKLVLSGTVPEYVNSISKITLPNGEDTFVSQNQSYTSLDLGVRENLAWTGGTLTLGTSLNRIDVFGNTRSSRYSIVPASLSYFQNGIGYNDYKWQKKIEPVKMELANRNYIMKMETIALHTIDYYFDVLLNQIQKVLAKQNLNSSELLYKISQERFKIGSVSKSELLQLELNLISYKNQLIQDSVDVALSQQKLSRFLAMDQVNDFILDRPENTESFTVNSKQAISFARENSEKISGFKVQILESKRAIARIKADNSLKFNVQLNFGLSNSAQRFNNLLNTFQNQQNVSVTFAMPLLDWGLSKTQRQRAEANYDLVKNQTEQDAMDFEEEIALQISKWNLNEILIKGAKESKVISEESFNLEFDRYKNGTISINDLNNAQARKDNANIAYILALKSYWQNYHSIRMLTFYDFKNQKMIAF